MTGFMEEDSPYASDGQKGTFYFEFSRPLRTMDRLQQVHLQISSYQKWFILFYFLSQRLLFSQSFVHFVLCVVQVVCRLDCSCGFLLNQDDYDQHYIAWLPIENYNHVMKVFLLYDLGPCSFTCTNFANLTHTCCLNIYSMSAELTSPWKDISSDFFSFLPCCKFVLGG